LISFCDPAPAALTPRNPMGSVAFLFLGSGRGNRTSKPKKQEVQ
jgi:hypothetical protein